MVEFEQLLIAAAGSCIGRIFIEAFAAADPTSCLAILYYKRGTAGSKYKGGCLEKVCRRPAPLTPVNYAWHEQRLGD